MKRVALVALMQLLVVGPLFAKTQKSMYQMHCSALWPAVTDTVRNSGNYAVIFVDKTEMIASFAIGLGQALRIASATLDDRGDTCEMAVQMPYHESAFTDDGGDFKKRVDTALAAQSAPAKSDGHDK